MSTAQRALARAIVAMLAALTVFVVGPEGVAIAAAPSIAIDAPVSGSWTSEQMPVFSGTTDDTLDPVTLEIYAGASATGSPVQTLVVLAPVEIGPLEGSWEVTTAMALAPGQYTAVAEQTDTASEPPELGTSEFPVTFTVAAAPLVTTSPASRGVKVGEAATFTATASGMPAPEVQWQESTDFGATWTDDTTDSGNTTDTLTVSPTTVAESGHEYQAVFTNEAGTMTSQPATLTVFEKPVVPVAPSVTSNPADQTVLAGEGAAFTAAASGTPAPEVRWQVSTDKGSTWANDTTDAGNTTDTLAVLHATVAESGREYRAVFTNSADTAMSEAAKLTVESPPPSAPSAPPAPVVTPAPSAPAGSNNSGTAAPPATSPLSPTPSAASPTPPTASFTWSPSAPAAGENVVLASTSTALASPIAAYAWDLAGTGGGAFTAGGPVISTSFATSGDHVVRLRVTDADGLASVATETIPVAATPLVLMQPFPVVRIAGSESSSGARISLLTVQAPVGTQVEVTCRGHHCPSRSQSRVVVATSKNRAGTVVLTFGRFERSLQAGVVLEIRVSKPGEIGKYTSFAIRRGRLPARVDACVEPADPKPIPCPAS